MEEKGYAPEHFRVSAKSLWEKGIKNSEMAQAQWTKDLMTELSVAEQNLNRNIDSGEQLSVFIKTSSQIRDVMKRRMGEQWQI